MGFLGAAALLVLFSTFALAQQPPPNAGSILEGLKQRPPGAPPLGGDVLPRVEDPRPALGAPGLKVNVIAFKISGNTIFTEDVLLAAAQEFVGKEQNIDGLNDAATKVRAYYRERGYFLAQAYLPQQEIKGGVVEIAVIEARVGKVAVNFKEGTRYSENLIRGIVERHLRQGDLITESDLETPLLLLNDFPNAVVTSEIKPSQTVGAADLTIHVSDTPGWLDGSVDMDNYGNRFTGAIRTGVSVNISNPLQFGDQLSYRGFITDDDMGFYRLAYAVPVGYYGTRIGLAYSSFHYRLGKEFIDTRTHGAGAVQTIFAFHPLVRTRSSNVILQFAYEAKTLSDRNEVSLTITDQSITASKLGVVGDFRDGMLGGGLNSYSYAVTEGKALFRGTIPDPSAVGRFAKQNYEFRRLQKITDNASLLLAISGQLASKNLSSAEKFSLGGASGVRAYPTGEALGDTGYLFQGEMRYIVPNLKLGGGDVTVSGFYDQGGVQIQKDFIQPAAGTTPASANYRNISGYGVGGAIGRDSDFILRGSFAWRNENEAPQSDTASRIPRVWVQGIKWF